MATRIAFASLFPASLVLFALGCGPKPEATQTIDPVQPLLTSIANAYSKAATKLGRPPASPEELTPHLPAGQTLATLVSPRDGQPLEIVFHGGAKGTATGVPIIAHEQQGKAGKRMVVDAMMTTSELSAEEFAKLEFPKSP